MTTEAAINREIRALAIPSILANITVPLVGMVDLAIAGHLHTEETGSAAYMGAVSLGALLFSILYWNFTFLRAGTGGLTAQAYGRIRVERDAPSSAGLILVRGLALALGFSLLLLLLQWPFAHYGLQLLGGSQEVNALAFSYFRVRIWAAPATLSLMVLRGWFIGMQDSRSSMWTDLTVNGVNVLASLALAFPAGLGFDGIALGTVIAQYAGLALAAGIVTRKYRPNTAGTPVRESLRNLRAFFSMNAHLFLRSLCFMLIYGGYSAIAARQGDSCLAAASLLMNLLMLFSYFTDGFAYAGEALTGRFIGEGNRPMLRLAVRQVFVWSMGVALLWVGIYATSGKPLVALMTDDPAVRQTVQPFLWWLVVMPPMGCAAFTWDGIYIGATAARSMFVSMLLAAAAFFGIWGIGQWGMHIGALPGALHLLLGAYFAHLLARTVWLSIRYRKDVLSLLSNIQKKHQ